MNPAAPVISQNERALQRFAVACTRKTNSWSAGAWRYCWRNPPCPSFAKGGDPKAPFCKGGRAERGGIWKRCGNEENIRQQYRHAPALQMGVAQILDMSQSPLLSSPLMGEGTK